METALLVFVLGGWISSFSQIWGLKQPNSGALFFTMLLGACILANIVTGGKMLASKSATIVLPLAHRVSSSLMILSLIGIVIAIIAKF